MRKNEDVERGNGSHLRMKIEDLKKRWKKSKTLKDAKAGKACRMAPGMGRCLAKHLMTYWV